ncbi:hypothetical protein FRX31_004303, partial [Thalictrum thalictroides]
GGTLCSFPPMIQGGLLSSSQSLMYQLCKGVAFGHGHGVLHRYSSSFPSNKVK